ncbi:hypothetical protein EDC94DRAFT_133991 [Helicostylum pulchrum]|nr:hypothetical protein EDC94DRAFT_133991 [Helicostylum pulchrum]
MGLSVEGICVHGMISVLLEPVFQSEPLLSYQWVNDQLNVERSKNTLDFKPDFVVFASQSSRKFNIGVSEIKSPINATSNNEGESDLLNLGREMKQMFSAEGFALRQQQIYSSLKEQSLLCN